MILDFDRRFLFLKSTKTAGTSIEIALSSLCSPNSIITPTVDENLRVTWGGHHPQNYSVNHQNINWDRKLREYEVPPWGKLHFFNHMSIDLAISQIGLGAFQNLFSFGFTRNPIERALSSYTWIAACNRAYYEPLSLIEHRNNFRKMLRSNFDSTKKWLCSETYGVQVTKVYKYEQMQFAVEDIHFSCDLDRLDKVQLPNAKVGFKDILGFSRENLIDEDSRILIEDICAWEYLNHYPVPS